MVNRHDGLDQTFLALADPTRRAIVRQIASRGAVTVSDLAAPFNMSLPAVSKHLRVLERAGILSQQREGRTRWCRLRAEPLRTAATWIDQYRAFWELQLDSLEQHLRSTKKRSNPPKPKEKL